MLYLLLFVLSLIDLALVWKWFRLSTRLSAIETERDTLRQQFNAEQLHARELQFQRDCQAAVLQGTSVLNVIASDWSGQSSCEFTPPIGLKISLVDSTPVILDYCGLTAEEVAEIRVDRHLLQNWTGNILSRDDLRTGDPVRLPTAALARIEQLSLLKPPAIQKSETILLLSHVPLLTGDPDRDKALVLQMTLLKQQRNLQKIEQLAQEEVRLVREMLDLRALTDVEFHSPAEMVAEFLSRLAQACHFERGALYLSRQTTPSQKPSPYSQGGRAVLRPLYQPWLNAEQSLVQAHQQRRDVIFLNPETVRQESSAPFHSGLLLPLTHGSELVGHLILTGHQLTMPAETDLQLAKWGADYLMTTIVRTVNQVTAQDRARRDPLTRLANRHAFDEVLKRSVRSALGPHAEPCGLILLDLDGFKQINDLYGHQAGDAVLKHAAQVVMSVSHSRVTDSPLVARYGGEEIAVILPNMGEPGAMRIAEAIREALASTPVPFAGQDIPVTTSGGVAICPLHGASAESLVAMADSALYRAKRLGRNRIEVASLTCPQEIPSASSHRAQGGLMVDVHQTMPDDQQTLKQADRHEPNTTPSASFPSPAGSGTNQSLACQTAPLAG